MFYLRVTGDLFACHRQSVLVSERLSDESLLSLVRMWNRAVMMAGMYDVDSYEAMLGRSAEVAITRRLSETGVHVVPTHAFLNNNEKTTAPMMRTADGELRVLPDLLCFPEGGEPYWLEVKARTYPKWSAQLDRWEHGVDMRRIIDYSAVEEKSGFPVHVALFEVHSPQEGADDPSRPTSERCVPTGTWFKASLQELIAVGRYRYNWPKSGEAGLFWPRRAMRRLFDDPVLAAVPDRLVLPQGSKDLAPLPDWLPDAPRHSVLVLNPAVTLEDVRALMQRGIKVHWFVEGPPTLDELEIFADFDVGLLNLHPLPEDASELLLIDGNGASHQRATILALGRTQSAGRLHSFNAEQYLVEHAPADENLQVRAGAGTGKTRVMIQRVLFLLGTDPELQPSQIALITFTRKATREMKDRLVSALSIRFRLTGAPRFLRWLLALPTMQISTIPSFGRDLLSRAGASLGISPDFRIRQFTLERRQIIRDALDRVFQDHPPTGSIRQHLSRPLFQFEKVAARFWGQLENKGLDPERVTQLDWGQGVDDASERINDIFATLFADGEARMQELKELENALTLSDLTRQLRQLHNGLEELALQPGKWRHLFVDEFQDTDEVQIDLVDLLSEILDTTVFVVGDVKQSIYRFRGADYTAFDRLSERFGERGTDLRQYALQKNYRTSRDIMGEMEPWFMAWGHRGLLPYAAQDRLIAERPEEGEIHIIESRRADRAEKMLEAIEYGMDVGGGQAVVLVRTNYEATQVHQVCSDAGVTCLIDRSGGFFQSQAVREFRVLVQALLYPDEPHYQLNLMHSSYSAVRLHWTSLWGCAGNRGLLMSRLSHWEPHPSWPQFQKDCRLKPIPAVLRAAIKEMKPIRRYYDRLLPSMSEADARDLARRYKGNLDKLMSMLHEQFDEEFITLNALADWLEIQMTTNTDENEAGRPELGDRSGVVCMTVHKSKGLEFHTVVLPLTNRSFFASGDRLVVDEADDEGRIRVGWYLRPPRNGDAMQNSHHSDLYRGDRQESAREETRLLYVALTRVKRHLVIARHRPDRASDEPRTWGELLLAGTR